MVPAQPSLIPYLFFNSIAQDLSECRRTSEQDDQQTEQSRC